MNTQPMTLRQPHHRLSLLVTIIRIVLTIAAVLCGIVSVVALSASESHATEQATTEPYGGCDEAWQYPQTQGADDCRALGWIVSRRLVVTDRGIVMYSTLPHCRQEDGSGQRNQRCTWNIGPTIDGDGRGLAYWFGHATQPIPGPIRGRDRVAHYVWRDDPTSTNRWNWVSHRLADALAEGSGRHASTRPWERCVTRPTGGDHRWVKCPNGDRMEVS